MREYTGIGDIIAATTGAVGIKPCRSCEKRRVALNEWSAKYARYVPERLRERLGLTRAEDAEPET